MQSRATCIHGNFEVWMWKQVIGAIDIVIFLKASLNGKSVGHISWNFDETFFEICSSIAICESGFQTQKMLSNTTYKLVWNWIL